MDFRGQLGKIAAPTALILVIGAALGFLFLFFLWPTATLIGKGFLIEGRLDLTVAAQVLTAARTWEVLTQTLIMAFGGTVGSVLFGLPGAYVLYRLQFAGRSGARALIAVPFVLPTVAVSAGYRAFLREDGLAGALGLEGTMGAVVAAMIFFNMSLVARTVGSIWARLDPRAEEAAQALGAAPLRIWCTVTAPRLMPAISSVAAVVFLYCATAYSIVLILGSVGTATLETEIYTETVEYLNLPVASVLSILQLVVVVGALWAAGRARTRLERTQKLVSRPTDKPVQIRHIPVILAAALPVVVLVVTPLSYVLVRSFSRGGQWTLANYTDLFNAKASTVLQVSVAASLGYSLLTALVAASIALLVGLSVAVVISRRPQAKWARWGISALDGLFMLPLGVSAVTVGFGFLVTVTGPPLNLAEHWMLLPLAQAVVALPLVVRITLPVLRAIDPRMRQVAAVLGAGQLRVLATIDGPILARSALVAAGFALAVSIGEFGATSFLVRPNTLTVPVVIYQLVSRPGAVEQGLAMSASVVLSVITALIMVGVERLRPPGEAGI